MEHILEHRKRITEQLVKSYSGEESTTGAPKFIVISHSLAGSTALTAILNALEKSQSEEALSIFVDNNIDESKHQVPSAIDSIVLKGFSVEQLLIIKEDTQGKLEKSYIPELIDLIKADDSVIEEKYKKKIAALKERRDPEGIEKAGEEKKESKEFQGLGDEGVVSDEDKDNVEKSEGARGGKVIGHTKSGKPIYMNQNAMAEKHYSSKDHEEAAYKHLDHNKETGKDSDHHATQFDRHMDSSRHKKAQEDVEKETQGIKKSEELTPGEIQKARIIGNIQDTYNTNLEEAFEKGGKRAEIGEVRMWGKDKWVKHQDGWVNVSKTGKATLERPGGKREVASAEHTKHAEYHLDTHNKANRGDTHLDPSQMSDSTLESKHADLVIMLTKNHLNDEGRKYLKAIIDEKDKRAKENETGVVEKPNTTTLDKDHKGEDSKTLVERYREIKNNHDNDPKQISHNDILDSMRRTHAASKNQVEEALVEHGESKIGFSAKTKKPTLEEVDTAFSKVGKALAEGRDPDAITSLRDEAKKLGAAYGMSNEKIDEAISTSKKAHQDNYQPTAKESLDHAMNFHRDESSNDNLNSKVRALHNTLADYYDGHRSLDKKDLHEALEIAKDRVENEETEGPRKKWQSVVNHLQGKIKVTK